MNGYENLALMNGEVFKALMRNIASSVAVISTSNEGRLHGMTATAVCSVSADPATILIVVNRSTRSHPIISSTKQFTVNILAEDQHEISGLFASKQDNPFSAVEHRIGLNGNPIIVGAAAHLECSTYYELDVGTHTIFVGHVTSGDVSAIPPLVYHEGQYKLLSPRKPEREVASMFIDRWSPRAFSPSEIDDETLMSLFEAARWAPSSMNAQPWRFVYVRRGHTKWQAFLDTLSNTNRSWSVHAAALIAFVSKKTLQFDGKEFPSPTHSFDTGAAWMSFALQANLSDWYTHGMAGFNAEKLAPVLELPEDFAINAVVAIGRLGDSSSLPDHLKAREIPSERMALSELVFNGTFGAT